MAESKNTTAAEPRLFRSMRIKLWLAAGCALVLVIGALTIPAPAPSTVVPPQERAMPLLERHIDGRRRGSCAPWPG